MLRLLALLRGITVSLIQITWIPTVCEDHFLHCLILVMYLVISGHHSLVA